MHKGEPVLVRGKFKTSTYEDRDGRPRTETRITADTVGHDLSRGVANYIRHRPTQAAADADATGDQAPWSPNLGEGHNLGEGPEDMIDEDAIERFGRDLGDADLAARALTEDEDEDKDDEDEDAAIAADTATSAVPATPY
jgi:single-strand DNA-binding protein